MEPPLNYRSYILRLWEVTREGEPAWQASLQSITTGQRRGFPDLESLFDYLAFQSSGEDTAPDIGAKPTTSHR